MSKHIRAYITIAFLATCFQYAVQAQERNGSIKATKGEAIEFATVVLLDGEKQAAVAVTDSLGRFTVAVADGNYQIKIQNVAYKPLEQSIEVKPQTTALGVFKLEESVVGLNEIAVTGSAVTRKADRFIMQVGDMPAMLNKDATEVLQLSPGVWIDDNGISINGTGGVKVFVNERELRLTQKELATYLRNFRSSDIARIEIIPQAGAEYSADSHGGVIRIILRKQLEYGMAGNVALHTLYGKHIEAYRPSATVNARMGKWNINAFGGGYIAENKNELIATRDFYDVGSDALFRSESHLNGKPRTDTERIGAIYDHDNRNSFGVEVEHGYSNTKMPSSAVTTIRENGITVNSTSDYRRKETDKNFSATFNYIYKPDTAGTILKLIADYTRKQVRGENDYHAVFEEQNRTNDSVYRNDSFSDYGIFSADVVINKQFGNKTTGSVGAKYTRNKMFDEVFYQSRYQSAWQALADYNYSLNYTEHIGALYATFATGIGPLSISAGIRGEHTRTEGREDSINRNHFDLFLSVNLTYSFDAMRLFMLTGQYARNIQRPNFRHLNPNRIQYSEYSYMVGNPTLRPTYINRFSVTAVYKYRYILSVGGNLHRDLIREVSKTDPTNETGTYVTPENHATENHYFAALILPLQITERLNIHTNTVGVKQDIRATAGADDKSHYLYFANISANVTLPADFYAEIAYSGTSRLYSANSGIHPRHLFHVSVKKQLFSKRLTASVGINNIFGSRAAYFSDTERFRINTEGDEASNSRFFRFGIQYSFDVGKSFGERTVESVLSEEKSRLQKSQEMK